MEEFSKIMQNSRSTDANLRNQAEATIKTITLDNNMLELFFNYLTSNDHILNKKSAAVVLRNYIKNYWYNHTDEANANPHKLISPEVKKNLKENILNLIIHSDRTLIPTFKEMIVNICSEGDGYINAWPELMKLFASVLNTRNYSLSLDIYDIIKKVTKRYRVEALTVSLVKEIKEAIANIAPLMTQDCITFIGYFYSKDAVNPEQLALYLQLTTCILHIFFSFNSPDFPEYFEDNLETWMKILNSVLDYDIVLDSQMFRYFIKMKTIGMRCLNLYCTNYYDDFFEHHNIFIETVWRLLKYAQTDIMYAKLVKQLLDYYKTLFQGNRAAQLFSQDAVQLLIDNLVIPNLQLTSKELDDYEENPINFTRIELEEVDMDSNKYHSINLLKSLLNLFPNTTAGYIQPLINKLLTNYYSNPRKNWMEKIVAINLIFATMIKTFAQKIGATEVKITQDEISNLIQTIFIREFQETPNSHEIAQIYSFKFLSTFRLQIPLEWLESTIGMLVRILGQQNVVAVNACLLTLEKILFMKDTNSSKYLAANTVNSQSTFINLISSLLDIIANEFNIFAMRCFYQSLRLGSGGFFLDIMGELAKSVDSVLQNIIKNPSEDQFNFFFFDTIAIMMKKLSESNADQYTQFLATILGTIHSILSTSQTDLMGYAFQIFALELSLSELNSTLHNDIINSILFSDNNWDISMKYLYNPFIAYIKVSMIRLKEFYTKNVVMDRCFWIVIKLLENKSFTQMFDFLDIILNYTDINTNYNSLKQVFYHIVSMYNNLKENNKKLHREYSRCLVVFIAKFEIKTNSATLLDILGDAFVYILADLSDYLTDLDSNKNKKLVTYAYCLIMNDYFAKFNIDQLKFFTTKLISHLEKFNKIMGTGIDRIMENEINYNSNTYNKLLNAEISIKIPEYENVYLHNENNIFFSTMETIRIGLNVNLVSEVLGDLSKRERDFISNYANRQMSK